MTYPYCRNFSFFFLLYYGQCRSSALYDLAIEILPSYLLKITLLENVAILEQYFAVL